MLGLLVKLKENNTKRSPQNGTNNKRIQMAEKNRETGKTVTIPDGMYDYKGLNTTIQSLIGRVGSPRMKKIRVYCPAVIFTAQTYRAVISVAGRLRA